MKMFKIFQSQNLPFSDFIRKIADRLRRAVPLHGGPCGGCAGGTESHCEGTNDERARPADSRQIVPPPGSPGGRMYRGFDSHKRGYGSWKRSVVIKLSPSRFRVMLPKAGEVFP